MDARTGGLISAHFTFLMRLPFGLIRGGGISCRLPFGFGRVEFKLHDGMDACGTGSMVDCESVSKVEDDRRLSPERGEEDSHRLDSSSRMEAGEGGYSCPMDVSSKRRECYHTMLLHRRVIT